MNIGELIDHYQEWVDYDMKRYGKISDETNRDIEEASLQIVKDKYGDYEVIAGKYNESLKGENGWIKRWNSLDKYYKGDLVISKISSPYEAWHIEKVAPNGRTIKHLGNYKSLKVAMDAAEQYLIKNESKSIENNVVPDESLEASKSRTFIELPEFQKLWQKFNLTDDDLMSLQNQIINGNQAVSLGSNVYKIRFSPKQISKGKDTTDRVIYIDYIIDSKVYLVTIFSKSDESNLTKDELNNIRKLSKSLEVK